MNKVLIFLATLTLPLLSTDYSNYLKTDNRSDSEYVSIQYGKQKLAYKNSQIGSDVVSINLGRMFSAQNGWELSYSGNFNSNGKDDVKSYKFNTIGASVIHLLPLEKNLLLNAKIGINMRNLGMVLVGSDSFTFDYGISYGIGASFRTHKSYYLICEYLQIAPDVTSFVAGYKITF